MWRQFQNICNCNVIRKYLWLNWWPGHRYCWYYCGFSYLSWRKWSEFQAKNHLFKERKWSESWSSLATLDNTHLLSHHWASACVGNAHLTSKNDSATKGAGSCPITVEVWRWRNTRSRVTGHHNLFHQSANSIGSSYHSVVTLWTLVTVSPWGEGVANDCPSRVLLEGKHLVKRLKQDWTLFTLSFCSLCPSSAPDTAQPLCLVFPRNSTTCESLQIPEVFLAVLLCAL